MLVMARSCEGGQGTEHPVTNGAVGVVTLWAISDVNWALSPKDGIRESENYHVDFHSGRAWGICRTERATFVSPRKVQI